MAEALLIEISDGPSAPWRQREPLPPDPSGRFVRLEPTAEAHARGCGTCKAGRNCPVQVALTYCLGQGVHPDDFAPPATPELHRAGAYIPATAAEISFLAATHIRWEQEGVVAWAEPAGGAERAAAPAFVTYRTKVVKGAEVAAMEWAANHPEQLAAAAEYDSMWPPELFHAKPRGVYSLKATNSRMRKPPMAYPTVLSLAAAALPRDKLVVMDFAEGFTSVRIAHEARERFRCSSPGSPDIVHCSLPFGWRGAPFVFCFLSAVAAEIIVRECFPLGSRAVTYIDDIAVSIPSGVADAEAEQAKARAVETIRALGFRINPDKTQGPATKAEFLGWNLDTASAAGVTVSVPGVKLAAGRSWAEAAAACDAWPTRAWDRLTGRLQHATTFTPGAGPFMADLYAAKRHAKHAGRSDVRVTPRALAALQWCIDAIGGSQAIQPWHATVLEVAAVMSTDASAEGGLGVAIALPRERYCHTLSAVTEASFASRGNQNSTALELLAVEAAVCLAVSLIPAPAPGSVSVLRLFTDSQAAAALLRKGRSARCDLMNDTLRSIGCTLQASRAVLDTTWTPRASNAIADALSHPYAQAGIAAPLCSELLHSLGTAFAAQTKPSGPRCPPNKQRHASPDS